MCLFVCRCEYVESQELYKKLDLSPYAVHTTFQYGGTEGKRHRLREGKIFYDPPEYFDTAGIQLSPLEPSNSGSRS